MVTQHSDAYRRRSSGSCAGRTRIKEGHHHRLALNPRSPSHTSTCRAHTQPRVHKSARCLHTQVLADNFGISITGEKLGSLRGLEWLISEVRALVHFRIHRTAANAPNFLPVDELPVGHQLLSQASAIGLRQYEMCATCKRTRCDE